MSNKLAIAIHVVNFVKASSVKARLYCYVQGMDADDETVVSHGCLIIIKRRFGSLG